MKEINYQQFLELLNEKIGCNENWPIEEIVKHNELLDAYVLSDDYFATYVETENEEAIKEVAELFIKDGINLVNQNCTSKMIDLFSVIKNEIEIEKDDEIIKKEDNIYYISLIPKSDEIPTFYSFLDKYCDEILSIAIKYNTEISLILEQLDSKINGIYKYSKDCCEGALIINSSLVKRDLYIACALLNQAAANISEFEQLNGMIYIDDCEVVVINDDNLKEESNKEILEMIENEDDNVECLLRFDENGNIIEGSVEAIDRFIKGYNYN